MSEEGFRSPEIRVIDGCELPYDCQELKLGPLKELKVLFTAEPPLQPHKLTFYKHLFMIAMCVHIIYVCV